MNSAGEVDWSNRSVPSAANLDGEDAYDEEQGFYLLLLIQSFSV